MISFLFQLWKYNDLLPIPVVELGWPKPKKFPSFFFRKLHWLKNIWFFFLISENFYYFSAPKMDRDIFIIQPDFFFLSEHHRVHMQLCDVHAKFVNTLFVLFVNTFISSENKPWWSISNTGIFNTHTHTLTITQ